MALLAPMRSTAVALLSTATPPLKVLLPERTSVPDCTSTPWPPAIEPANVLGVLLL